MSNWREKAKASFTASPTEILHLSLQTGVFPGRGREGNRGGKGGGVTGRGTRGVARVEQSIWETLLTERDRARHEQHPVSDTVWVTLVIQLNPASCAGHSAALRSFPTGREHCVELDRPLLAPAIHLNLQVLHRATQAIQLRVDEPTIFLSNILELPAVGMSSAQYPSVFLVRERSVERIFLAA